MHRIDIKPLSVNHLSTVIDGQIRKSKKHKKYVRDIGLLLPAMGSPGEGPLRLELEFGMSNPNADIDNPVKPIQDCLQAKYQFNDRQIHELLIRKKIVEKNEEYFSFSIETLQKSAERC